MKERYLHLADGTTLTGYAFGYAAKDIMGEVVFSTGMTGYCQSLTDPSFAGQILTFTYPLIGNYGVPRKIEIAKDLLANFESDRIWAKAVVVSSLSPIPSHYQGDLSFSDWLEKEKIPGIMGIDTRALTIKLREHGVMNGVITDSPTHPGKISFDPKNLVRETSTKESHVYQPEKSNGKQVVLLDCGVKQGIIRRLLKEGYKVTRLPYDGNPLDVHNIDGVVISNGPGDPKDCPTTISTIQKIIQKNIPMIGICLGHQLLSLAIGADTYKLSYGHRGLNQPCQDVLSKKTYITSQNHGYAVDGKTLPKEYVEWFKNLNDGTNEGIVHKKLPIRSIQFHPEGCPGPYDTDFIFSLI
jgi:carbamoyl-phosphate synthase small subunit